MSRLLNGVEAVMMSGLSSRIEAVLTEAPICGVGSLLPRNVLLDVVRMRLGKLPRGADLRVRGMHAAHLSKKP